MHAMEGLCTGRPVHALEGLDTRGRTADAPEGLCVHSRGVDAQGQQADGEQNCSLTC